MSCWVAGDWIQRFQHEAKRMFLMLEAHYRKMPDKTFM